MYIVQRVVIGVIAGHNSNERGNEMARLGDVKITVELDPIVKLVCLDTECKFNMLNIPGSQSLHCQMKHIVIDRSGMCESREVKGE